MLLEGSNLYIFAAILTGDVADSYGRQVYLYFDPAQDDNTTNVGAKQSVPAEAVWDANYKAVCKT